MIISITIPNAKLQKAIDALCERGNYQATLPDGTSNLISKATFARQMIGNFIGTAIQNKERNDAINAVYQSPPIDVSDITVN